jgi:hypothetical protein
MGPAISTTFDFSIANRLAEVRAERIAQEAMGWQSEDERELETHEPPPPPPFDTWSTYLYSPSPPPTSIHNSIESSSTPSASPLPSSYLLTSDAPSATTATATPAIPSSPSISKQKTKKPRHKKTDHRKAGAKQCRLKNRLRHLEKTCTILKAVNLRRRKDLNPIRTSTNAADLDHASTAWIGKSEAFDRVHYDLDRLTGPEFKFVKHSWDGKYVLQPLTMKFLTYLCIRPGSRGQWLTARSVLLPCVSGDLAMMIGTQFNPTVLTHLSKLESSVTLHRNNLAIAVVIFLH